MNRKQIKQHIERLTQAVRVMTGVKPEDFSIYYYRHFVNRGAEGPCGTVGCIAGHCGMDPWFRRRGLSTYASSPGQANITKNISDYFGDPRPFYYHHYTGSVTIPRALTALKKAIRRKRRLLYKYRPTQHSTET